MAEATLKDVIKKLDDVKSAVSASGATDATTTAKAAEAAAESAKAAAESAQVQLDIRDNTAPRKPDKEKESFGLLGLIAGLTAAAAGLVVGLTAGFINFYKHLFKLAGKLAPKWLDDIFKKFKAPKWLDDFFKQFTKEGKIAKKVMKIIDNFKMPKINFLDDVFKAFTKEGKLFKKITGIFDKFKMPKFTFITKITDFLKSTDKFKEISKAIDGVKGLFPKGKGGGTIGKMFKGIGDVFRPLGKIGKTLGDAFKPISKLLGGGVPGKGILKSLSFLMKGGIMGRVFRAFAAVGKAIAAPLAIIMGIIDGFFEAKDAVSKSDGIMASLVNGIIGAIGGFVDGAIFQLLDLIKSGISWIAGFFGFTEIEKALDSFSFSKMFNEFLDDIYSWFNLLFNNPVAALTNLLKNYFGAMLSIGDFIVDMLKKPFVWIMELFGWDDAAAATEKFSFSGTVMGVFDSAMAWITSLFSDPVTALTNALATIAKGYLTIGDFVIAPLKMAIAWVLRLFGWDEAAEATETFSFSGTIMGVFESAKKWIMGLFSWSQEPVKEDDSFIVKTIKGVVKTVKDWFGNMFKFDSTGDTLKSILNIMMWIPNLLVKAMLGVTSFVAGLLGFDEKSKDLATAGKDFSFGDLIGKGLKALADWLKGMFDIDVDAIGKSLLGDTVYNALFGSDSKGRKELEAAGIKQDTTDFGKWDVDLGDLRKSLEGMTKEQMKMTLKNFKGLASDGQLDNTQEVAELFKKMMPEMNTGGLVAKTGFAKVHKDELMLDQQAAGVFMKAAQLLTGSQALEQGRSGGGAPVIINNNNNVDNSSRNVNQSSVYKSISTRDTPISMYG